jgi:hypothetical protein
MSTEKALEIVRQEADRGCLDADTVAHLVELILKTKEDRGVTPS